MRDQVHVSLVVFAECDPSIVYGIFDTLWAAGRFIAEKEDDPIFIPRIVSTSKQPMELVTGVSIVPQDGINEVNRTDVVFVPNVMVKSAACLRGLDRRLLDWIRAMHGQGAALYSACGGSLAMNWSRCLPSIGASRRSPGSRKSPPTAARGGSSSRCFARCFPTRC